jgi:hypothetical protein
MDSTRGLGLLLLLLLVAWPPPAAAAAAAVPDMLRLPVTRGTQL